MNTKKLILSALCGGMIFSAGMNAEDVMESMELSQSETVLVSDIRSANLFDQACVFVQEAAHELGQVIDCTDWTEQELISNVRRLNLINQLQQFLNNVAATSEAVEGAIEGALEVAQEGIESANEVSEVVESVQEFAENVSELAQ